MTATDIRRDTFAELSTAQFKWKNKKRWIPLNILTYNTHVGRAQEAGLKWLLRRTRPHLILLQEVKNLRQLRDDYGHEYYVIWTSVDTKTVILARKSRFELRDIVLHELPGNRHEREMVVAVLYDKRTKRLTYATSLHVDPLGAGFFKAEALARGRHSAQISVYVDFMKHLNEDEVGIVGGDFNERLADSEMGKPANLRPYTALARFKKAGFKAAFQAARQSDRVKLDDVFFTDDNYVKFKNRRQLAPKVKGGDHDAVFVKLKVQQL